MIKARCRRSLSKDISESTDALTPMGPSSPAALLPIHCARG